MSEHKIFRCAVYSRKSSEEGLEQDFNSLEAQREAGEAYIRSQAHEGWKLIPDRFDDGGFSGGNMERPALGKLMSMVRDGKVDVIVIYKIDRLTRSLTDFARLAEIFDKHGVSFVSVTQQFNTTTPMGRLMLNVLLSFAQFEREITGERIRDKIAASKKKGMWMGGPTPMGYDVRDRQLVVNETQAAAVRRVFELYLDEGNVPALLERLVRERIKTPVRVSSRGKHTGGLWFTRGHVYKLLSNPLYIGQIAHKGTTHPGQHTAIVNRKVWDAVQASKNTQGERARRRRAATPDALLAGKLFSEAGCPMLPAHTVRAGRRYEYYVEQLGSTGPRPTLEPLAPTTELAHAARNRPNRLRVPAAEIDTAVVAAVKGVLADRSKLAELLGTGEARSLTHASESAARLLASQSDRTFAECLVRVVVTRSSLRLTLSTRPLVQNLGAIEAEGLPDTRDVDVPLTYRKRGVQAKLTIGAPPPNERRRVDATLVTAIARAFDWFERLSTGKVPSIDAIAAEDGFDAGYVSHILPLAFHSPQTVIDILSGGQSSEMTANQLIWKTDVHTAWRSREHHSQ
ncbi:MAG: recombinase family protein [Hyphomicrobiales bacterium]|nr:MAG: recombinase family protein [Hyphomicrobiales bacterium]